MLSSGAAIDKKSVGKCSSIGSEYPLLISTPAIIIFVALQLGCIAQVNLLLKSKDY
jgi:hypothetical protein